MKSHTRADLTNGRIGHRFMPGTPPNLPLHTTGAKTGQARSTRVAYSRDGDAYLIVASEGGDTRSPGWYYNLKANPDIEINVGPKRFGATARPIIAGRRGRYRLSWW
jgi:deazaflavin-dependent oxidoreductase (nitroreductase family)